ncbi:Integrase, catalytic region [alpha proteobacterium BAL199]|nr:Integrase, catalytic region [alpha proteobacterium BAL199]
MRRAHLVQGKPIKAISRELKLSRKVIRKILRSGATAFEYERTVQPLPKIGAVKDTLDELLAVNEAKPVRERLTLIRIFEVLRGEGYEGGYDAVRRYARVWRNARPAAVATAYVPLSFAPGEAYQFDWSHEVVLLGGVTVKIKVAHVRLCHSRMLFVRAYPRESQEMVFDAHDPVPIVVDRLQDRPAIEAGHLKRQVERLGEPFRRVRRVGPPDLLQPVQGFGDLFLPGNVDPEADDLAVQGPALPDAGPAAVGKPLFDRALRVAVKLQPVANPGLRSLRVHQCLGVLAGFDAVADPVLESGSDFDHRGAGSVHVDVGLVEQHQPIVGVEQREAVG